MTRRFKALCIVVTFLACFCAVWLAHTFYPHLKSLWVADFLRGKPDARDPWSEAFRLVEIESSCDGKPQPAYFFTPASESPRPLLVSLHTWSGDYAQADPLADMSVAEGWNYIHPDFRGPNRSKDACLSEKVLADIDDAIAYAIDHGSVDPENLFVVGTSGGGYTALGSYMKTRHKIKTFLLWCPVGDLWAWFHQSRSRELPYAEDIVNCAGDGSGLKEEEARQRSPLFWEMPADPRGRVEIYAGIDDGYTGSVPISHSIGIFNRIAGHYGHDESLVGVSDRVKLLTRGMEKTVDAGSIGNCTILYHRNTPPVSLTIFDGGHEMPPEYCFTRFRELAGKR